MTEVGDVVEVDVTRIATGGEGVARAPDGRTLFVAAALPGERVRATVVEVRKRHGRAEVDEVVTAAPGRRRPPCPHVAHGCGGCDWQHATEDLQADLRRTIVRDALERIGRIADPVVEHSTAWMPSELFRTTVRAAVVGGRAGYRRRHSHDVVTVETCRVVNPLIEPWLVTGRFPSATEVMFRCGDRTSDLIAVVSPRAVDVDLPSWIGVYGADEVDAGEPAAIHEHAGGRTWRISARSFFQSSPQAADALVEEVRDAVGDIHGGTLVDLASGVGLFAGTVGAPFREIVAVEVSPTAVADAEVNLADLPVRTVRSTIERWRPEPADVVVADPPRAGLSRAGVDRVVATGTPVVVLVSCDAASLGRDAGLLVAAGYRLDRSRVLDLFPQTAHVEVVSRFVR